MSTDNSTVRYHVLPGHDGCYRIGDDGSFWSRLKYAPLGGKNLGARWVVGDEWKQIIPKPQKSGHIRVTLRDGRRCLLHHLVLEAFVGPRPPDMECRHLDGNPGNNRVTNLKWDTHTANMRDKKRHGTGIEGSKHKLAKLTEAAVVDIRARYAAGNVKLQQLADEHNVSMSSIWSAIKRKSWTHVT